MIAIIVRQPNGNGTYTARYGFTTDDSASTLDGVTLVPGFLEAVSELSHRINISRAQGGTPEPIEWGFDLIDWETTARRSVGILDGSVQLVGWVASLYVKLPATGIWSAPVLGENTFEIVAAPVSDGTISISCRERWIGKAQAVGFGVDGNRVGLVVGGLDVSIKTDELAEPVGLSYQENTGWFSGSPNSPAAFTGPRTAATSKDLDALSGITSFLFSCFPGTGPDLFERITGTVYITGKTYSQAVGISGLSGDVVDVRVTREFYDNEDPQDVSLYVVADGVRGIAGGAGALVGFVNDNGAIVRPQGDEAISGTVISFSPRLTSPDGFIAYTLIPTTIAFAPGWSPAGGTPGLNQWAYYGSTESINTDGTTVPAWATLDADLIPTGAAFAARMVAWTANTLELPLRLQRNDGDVKYDRFEIDARTRWTAKSSVDLVYTNYGWKQEPYSKAGEITDGIYGPPHQVVASGIRELKGPGTYEQATSFATLEEINTLPAGFCGLSLRADMDMFVTWEMTALRLYGVSTLSFGSSYAVVTPGASPWWASTPSPAEAASALLASAGFTAYTVDTINAPSWVAPTEAWGRAFDQDVTTTEAAKEICREFWLLARRNSVTNQAAADGEILQAPSFTLGDRSDIVTEPVVEYDHWAGEYRRRAYIAHVDEEYNSATPERYFGGWDTTGGGWGLALWNTCRNAWLHHGIQRSETFQSPSIRDPSTLGRMWANSSRSGATRARWLASQARYMTFAVAEIFPDWWAGDSVYPPTVSADAAGYDLSAYASTPLVVTEKRWDPMSLTTSVEVALPPAIPGAGGDVIQQTVSQDDDIIQQTSSISDNILQQVGN